MFNIFSNPRTIFTTLVFLLVPLAISFAQRSDNTNRFFLAQNLEQAGEFEKAKFILEDIYASEPENPMYFQLLNTIYLQLKLYDKSLKILTSRYQKYPTDYNLLGMIGKTHYLNGKENETFRIWDAYLASGSDRGAAAKVFSSYALDVRNIDKAVFYLSKAKELSPTVFYYSLDLLSLYLQTMQYKNASAECLLVTNNFPEQVFQLEARLNPYLSKSELVETAIGVFEPATLTLQGKQLLQKFYIQAKKFDAAFDIAKEFDIQLHKAGNEIYSFGIQLYQQGAYRDAVKAFDYITKEYRNSSLAEVASLYSVKSLDASLTESIKSRRDNWKPIAPDKIIPLSVREGVIPRYSEISKKAPQSEIGIEARSRLAQIYFDAGITDSARLYAADLVRNNNMNVTGADANFLLIKLFLQKQQPDSTFKYLDKIIENPFAQPHQKNLAKIEKALLHVTKGDFEKAHILFNDILQNTKDDYANDALEYTMLLNTTINDSASVMKYATGLSRIMVNDFLTADSIFKCILLDKNQFYLKSLLELKIIETKVALDDLSGAIAIINAVNQEKSNIFGDKVNYYLGKIYLFGLKQTVEAKKIFETFLLENTSSLYAAEVRELLKSINEKSF